MTSCSRPERSGQTCDRRRYARQRARQIAYGRWQPWADTTVVCEHLQQLRRAGASYRELARASGVSPMTIYRLHRDSPAHGSGPPRRIHAVQAQRLLAVTTDTAGRACARHDSAGARWRLRALTAMGHSAISLARQLDVLPSAVRAILTGVTVTVSPARHTAICDLYERIWDLRPAEHTPAESRAATAARARAARNGWPVPMGLDDDQIDDPAYQPRTHWRPAAGVGEVSSPDRHPTVMPDAGLVH